LSTGIGFRFALICLRAANRYAASARHSDTISMMREVPYDPPNPHMIRPVFTEIALFLTPFAVYFVYLWVTRADLLHPDAWPLRTVLTLTCLALALMAGSFLLLAHFSGEPKNSSYVPAHIENGKLVPGMVK
jgi:hypothetical protein